DCMRVSADERIDVDVLIELKGTAIGVTDCGLLDQPLHNLRVECLAIAVPDSIKVSIAELQKGASLHVRDLKLPEGVKALDDPELVVVHVTEPKGEPEAGGAEAAAQAEPELIGRQKGAEEAEGR